MNVQLRATGISKSFGGVYALQKVSFDIAEGEVHCLAGENGSGKSTIVKILSGILLPDDGTITVNGTEYKSLTSRQAIGLGIAVIHQDLSLFGTMSVRDNICLQEHVHHHRRIINTKYATKIATGALRRIGASLDLNTRVEDLSMAGKQQVAIARALALDAKVIFMDEPTTALTSDEVQELLVTIEGLKASGVSVIFISHKLDEVFSVADRITVFRSGEVVGTYQAKDLDSRKLSSLMTGHDVEFGLPEHHIVSGAAPVLEMQHVKASRINDVTLSIYPGEIVGFSGLLGSGRTETALTLFGLNKLYSGCIVVDGRVAHIGSPRDAIDAGIALVPEDRHQQGLFLDRNLLQNSAASVLKDIANTIGVIDTQRERHIGEQTLSNLQVNTRNLSLLAKSLSGGNQQKVLLGKWVATQPKILILDSPTVGVDVGSKAQIYEIIRYLSAQGMAIIVISDEEEELLALCNRIIVFQQGSSTLELTGNEIIPGFSAVYRNVASKNEKEHSDE